VHVVSGTTVEATYTTKASHCTGKYCYWYSHAFQVPTSQTCEVTANWTFVGKNNALDYTETRTATFTQAYTGSIKICLFVKAQLPPAHETCATHCEGTIAKEYLIAETILQATGALPPRTPLTVNNICSFNPGLGVRHPFKGTKGPGVYWDNSKDGVVDFGAVSYEGDNAVDGAFVNNSRGVLTWVAHCYPRETPWISYVQIAKAQSQPQPQPQQPQPPQQLQQAPPPLTGNAGMQLLDILAATTSAGDKFSPLPSYQPVGTLEPNTTPGCDVNSGGCITERPPDPTVF
jgi:hypothetical protein